MKPSTAHTLTVLRRRGAAGLTSIEAIAAVGTSRLAGRVHELRQAGYDIEARWETTEAGARISRYVLFERPVQLALLDSPSGAPAIPSPQVVRASLRSPRGALPAGSRPG